MSPRCPRPSRSTSEGRGAAHGPRHPAYPLLPRSLILLWGFGPHSFCFVGSVCVFARKRRFFVRFCQPFKTRPLFESFLGPSLFFCCLVVFLFAVAASLFFLFFRRWGNTNRVAVCDSPCVLLLATLNVIDPYILPRIFPKATATHLFFFCFLSVSRSLSLSLSFWCRSPLLCVQI